MALSSISIYFKTMKILNWGLLGTARINRSIIPPLRLSTRNRLHAVASRNLDRAQEYAAAWSIPNVHGGYDAMLDDPDIDVIYIPLPNTLHAEWAIKAAEAGKHVLCEKPLALTVEEVDAMAAAAGKAGTVLIEAFMYRFHARTLNVKQMVDEGAIGELHQVKGGFTFPLDRPKDVRWDDSLGGGSLWDVGCYPLNFSRYLIGSEPVEVYGHQVTGASGVDVGFTAQLRFPGDVMAQFDSGFRTQLRMYVEIAGSEGSIYVPTAFKPGPHSIIQLTRGNNVEHIGVDGNLLYLDEVEAMYSAVVDGEAPAVPLSDSRANVHAIQQLYASARSRQPVTTTP